jgi:hypothetical protein
MDNQWSDRLEKLKDNLFKIIYLILLIALLAFITNKSISIEAESQNENQKLQLVKDNYTDE